MVALINEFNDELNSGSIAVQVQDCILKNTPSSKDTHLDNIMSYNDILDYVERENDNEDGAFWKFREILSHSLISREKGKNDKIEI